MVFLADGPESKKNVRTTTTIIQHYADSNRETSLDFTTAIIIEVVILCYLLILVVITRIKNKSSNGD